MSADAHVGGRRPPGPGSRPAADEPGCLLTIAGVLIGFTGTEPTGESTAAAAALARDAERAARHLGFASWEAVVVESAEGVLGLAPSRHDSARVAAVALAAGTPLGAAQRAAGRRADDGRSR